MSQGMGGMGSIVGFSPDMLGQQWPRRLFSPIYCRVEKTLTLNTVLETLAINQPLIETSCGASLF